MSLQTTELKQTSSSNMQTIDAAAIQAWLLEYLSQLLEIDLAEIDIQHSFDSYGLDSSSTIALTAYLEDWLGFELDPTLLYEHPTIEQLSQYLIQAMQDQP